MVTGGGKKRDAISDCDITPISITVGGRIIVPDLQAPRQVSWPSIRLFSMIPKYSTYGRTPPIYGEARNTDGVEFRRKMSKNLQVYTSMKAEVAMLRKGLISSVV